MPLSTQDRSALIALLPELGPGQDDSGVLALVRDRWLACLDEVQADPGFDQVRAGLIRVMQRSLAEDPDVDKALHRAVEVVRRFPEQVLDGDATLLLQRHPAWVGLCGLELCDWDPSIVDDPLEWAVTLGGAGFSTVAGKGATARGEVLWALAEEAEGAGWTRRSRALLEAAAEAEFADADHAVQVDFLRALRHLDDGDDDAADLLEEVARSSRADARTVTHARHVLAELCTREGDRERARYWFGQARQSVDPEEHPEIVERLDAEIAKLDEGDGPDSPGRMPF